MKQYLRFTQNDLPAGLVVFLVALPLCLGIALASGAPLFSGIITGIVGGLVVSLLSGSQLSVSGPAAGLTVIVLNAITDLGSYESFLLAVVLAGVLQLILGYAKAGMIGAFFPSSVIKGMLAAIGIILILKQIPHLLGVDSDAFGEMEFFQRDGRNTFSEIFYAFEHISLGALLIGVFSLLFLIIWDKPFIQRVRMLKMVPGALLAVAFSIIINLILKQTAPEWAVTGDHLVSLPVIRDFDSLSSSFIFPDFSAFSNPKVYLTAFTIAIIASLETLLSLEAVDKLDPWKRNSPQDRELKAQGAGNIVAGLLGGIPLTAVIVRSSANVNAGGRSKMSSFYHGLFLLVAVSAIPMVLNLIPLSTLAAVLLLVGYKLIKPSMIRAQAKLGFEQFIPFVVTIVAILFTDLLIGIAIGMVFAVFYILRSNFRTSYFYEVEEKKDGNDSKIRIRLSEHVSFLNKPSLKMLLEEIPNNSMVTIDGSHSKQIDHDALEVIQNFRFTSKERNIVLITKNIPEVEVSGH